MRQEKRNNIAAILELAELTLKEHQIHCTVPNEIAKKEFEKTNELSNHLKKTLQNDDITICIKVIKNKEVFDQKYIYTNAQRYDAIREKEPNIEYFKEFFALSLE